MMGELYKSRLSLSDRDGWSTRLIEGNSVGGSEDIGGIMLRETSKEADDVNEQRMGKRI